MLNINLILAILVVHFLADFVSQTDYQAKNKSTSNKALFSHVFSYYCDLVVGLAFINYLVPMFPLNINFVYFCILNSVLHFITDYITSRINSILWKLGNAHNFFVGVGADQLIHYITLFITADWILS